MSDESGDVINELSRAATERRGWEAWAAMPQTKTLFAVLQEQADSFQTQIIYAPAKSIEDVLTQEFMKGRLEGRISVQRTFEGIMTDLDEEVQRLRRLRDAAEDDDAA